MLIHLEECYSLCPSGVIQATIYTTTLHNAPEVQISLSVTNNVYFFGVQFSAILAAKIGK